MSDMPLVELIRPNNCDGKDMLTEYRINPERYSEYLPLGRFIPRPNYVKIVKDCILNRLINTLID